MSKNAAVFTAIVLALAGAGLLLLLLGSTPTPSPTPIVTPGPSPTAIPSPTPIPSPGPSPIPIQGPAPPPTPTTGPTGTPVPLGPASPSPSQRPGAPEIDELAKELELGPEQRERVRIILMEAERELEKAVRERAPVGKPGSPEDTAAMKKVTDAVVDAMRARVREALTPEQRALFDKKERESR
jgi:hypothetical protein